MHTCTHTEGYSLVEVLVAIAILLLALVGPMTIAAKGVQSSLYAQNQIVAISLAQEGIEVFIAARNDAVLENIGGDLSASWDWVTDVRIDDCRDSYGCNIEYSDEDPLDSAIACTGVEGAGCELYYDESANRARYSLDSNQEITPYRRAIRVSDTSSGTGLQIESTVYWNTQLFSGSSQSLTLVSEVYHLYE